MKKILVLGITIMLLVTFTACGSSKKTDLDKLATDIHAVIEKYHAGDLTVDEMYDKIDMFDSALDGIAYPNDNDDEALKYLKLDGVIISMQSDLYHRDSMYDELSTLEQDFNVE